MNLNVELFDRIATWLEAGAPHEQNRGMVFDMVPQIAVTSGSTADNWCGSACCIAGAAISLGAPEVIADKLREGEHNVLGESLINVQIWHNARNLLGLTSFQADMLFAPFDIEIDELEDEDTRLPQADEITAKWAARTIRHLIASGEVNWGATEETKEI